MPNPKKVRFFYCILEIMTFKGEDSIFFIKYNDIWCPISCETSNSMSENAEMVNTTTRDNEGWVTEKPTTQSYNISLDAVLKLSEDPNLLSYIELRRMKRNRQLIEWRRVLWTGWVVDSGKAHISDISDSNAAGEEITFSLTLNGFGKPDEGTERVWVLGEDEDTLIAVDNDLIKA